LEDTAAVTHLPSISYGTFLPWQEAAVEGVPACITMEQVVTTTATTSMMETVTSNNQPAVTADTPSLTIGLFFCTTNYWVI